MMTILKLLMASILVITTANAADYTAPGGTNDAFSVALYPEVDFAAAGFDPAAIASCIAHAVDITVPKALGCVAKCTINPTCYISCLGFTNPFKIPGQIIAIGKCFVSSSSSFSATTANADDNSEFAALAFPAVDLNAVGTSPGALADCIAHALGLSPSKVLECVPKCTYHPTCYKDCLDIGYGSLLKIAKCFVGAKSSASFAGTQSFKAVSTKTHKYNCWCPPFGSSSITVSGPDTGGWNNFMACTGSCAGATIGVCQGMQKCMQSCVNSYGTGYAITKSSCS